MSDFFKDPKTMTREEFIQYRVQWICCTSVADAQQTLRNESDPEIVKAALAYERKHGQRATLLKTLTAKVRKLEGKTNG